MRRTTALSLGVALVAAACTGGADRPPTVSGFDGSRFKLASALQPFNACEELLGHLHREAGARVGPYGLPGVGGGPWWGGWRAGALGWEADAAVAAPSPPTTTAMAEGAGDQAASGEPGYSTTNTVEAGVDEPDLVKTDGRLMVALAQGRVRVVDVSGGAPVELASVELPGGWGANLLLQGTSVIVFGHADPGVDDAARSEPGIPRPVASQGALWQIDLSDPASPRLVRQLRVDGSVLTARVVDGVARVVVQSTPAGLDFVYPSGPGAEERAADINRRIVAESTVDDWLPGYRLLDGGGQVQSSGRLVECSAVSRPPTFHGFSTLTVLTIDLAGDLDAGNGMAVLADGQRVYASKDNLYVALGRWEDPAGGTPGAEPGSTRPGGPGGSSTATTAIHAFSISGRAPASYAATGVVPGQLMNDFSMSEHDGVLRVATTEGSLWGPSQPESESRITVLRRDDTTLVPVGEVTGLGRGEQIYGVRFQGAVGYVVTFRETDPLYVVDLSDPAAPAVRGELKILGYSAYLHDLGGGRLLGVGQDATEEGRRLGTQVSLFDVSDPANPNRVAQFTLPQGWSQAESDYQAFLWWAAAQLVMLPVNHWGGDGQEPFNGAIGLTVGDATIAERGRVSHPSGDGSACPDRPVPLPEPVPADGSAPTETPATTVESPRKAAPGMIDPGCVPWTPPLTRAVVVGSTVYTLSDLGLQASAIDDLAPLAWLPFS